MSWFWPDNQFDRINLKLDDIRRRLIKMSASQEQFDADLKTLTDSIVTLIAAVEALPKTDLTAEDQAVKDAAAAVQAELEKLNPPA